MPTTRTLALTLVSALAVGCGGASDPPANADDPGTGGAASTGAIASDSAAGDGAATSSAMEELDALNSRYRALADQRDGVLFVSAADVMRWDKNPEYYAEDQIHPSPLGSEAVGTYVGERVLAGQ